MICANCGAENGPDELFCAQCGAPVGDMEEVGEPVLSGAHPISGYLLMPRRGGEPFSLPERVLIGRMSSCDIAVQDKSVSREHARLARVPGGYLVEDLNSTNGTLINGERIGQPTVVRAGDVLTFGTVDFQLEVEPTVLAEPEAEASLSLSEAVVAPASVLSEPAPTTLPEAPAEPVAASSPMSADIDRHLERAAAVPVSRPPASSPDTYAESARLVDEVVSTAAHLADLAQRLATTSPPPAIDAGREVARIRDIVASVPAAPMTPDDVQEARDVLNGLTSNPSDFDLLVRLRGMVPQLARLVDQYGEVEQVLRAIARETEAEAPV